jgi:hypothetical protein
LDPVADADLVACASRRQLLGLAAALTVRRGADMATAQLVEPSGVLLLVAHVGFGTDFADHFAIVDDGRTTCAHAAKRGEPTEVLDLEVDPTVDDQDRMVLAAAGTRSWRSLPVADGSGTVFGVVSTHSRSPGRHDPAIAQPVVDRIAQLAAAEPGSGPEQARYERDLAVENQRLRQALSSRGVIGVAKGLLMATSNIGEDEAFAMLVRASQHQNVKLRVICERLISARTGRPS